MSFESSAQSHTDVIGSGQKDSGNGFFSDRRKTAL